MNLVLWLGVAMAQTSVSIEDTVTIELERAMAVFAQQEEVPHYAAVAVTDSRSMAVSARVGDITQSRDLRSRYLDVDLRVGLPQLDSTHSLRGFSALDDDTRRWMRVPIDDTAYPLQHALWRELDARYRDAVERIVLLRVNQVVRVEEEDPADDFEPREAVVSREPVAELEVDMAAWEPVLAGLSLRLDGGDDVFDSGASLAISRDEVVFVDTEGTRLVHGRVHARVSLYASTVAADGDEIEVFRAKDVHDPGDLPDPAVLYAWADEVLEELAALRDAPRGEPYSGPVVLTGKASGVFFHEVFGHRVEGHRQKSDHEGKTFLEYVGRPVLPDFISVVDDPTISFLDGEDLNGHFAYDDEGVVATPAPLVERGEFVGFLMSRSPIRGFANSNGHGRRSPGNAPVARMGNTIVQAHTTVSEDRLRRMLVDQVRRQGLEYGYIVDEIKGGFTMTGRVTPNAFNVRAATTWRVFADGRPDELVRGIDLVGTPLVAFGNLLAASDQRQVFNGVCGAESGWVPVSAVAPSLLFSKLEFQLKEKSSERPPLLVKPSDDGAAMLEIP